MEFISKEFTEALNLIIEIDGFEVAENRIIHKDKNIALYIDENGLYTISTKGGKQGSRYLLDILQVLYNTLHR